ncbi:MAG: T9SS type A sorting domain-containing protein [Bacteroidales bacterium]|nr:T9SS type A sorting domain-containing protein [Bacteroidales bacterium]
MKKSFLFVVVFAIICQHILAQTFNDATLARTYANYANYKAFFDKAYKQNPEIPLGILEAIAFTNTRFVHETHNDAELPSGCGIPKTYGVMGLTLDGKNVYRNNLITVSELSGYKVEDIINSPEINILAFAKAYVVVKKRLGIVSKEIEDQMPVMVELNEMYSKPSENKSVTLGQNFGLNSNIYTALAFLNNPQNQAVYNLPQRDINFVKIFGEANYNVLSSSRVTIAGDKISNKNGDTFIGNVHSVVTSEKSPDYAPALWNPAASCNYTYGRTMAATAIAIHTMEGTYGSCIYWFQDCASGVSTQYIMRSSDGQTTQMVLESNTAQHVYTENAYTHGIEHEAKVAEPSWYTETMFVSSAALVRDICEDNDINPLTCWYGPGCTGTYTTCLVDQCIRIKGHNQFPNGGHSDPGIYWEWRHYYHLLNPNPSITTVTAASGNFYDSGGQSGNYSNQERTLTLINPTSAGTIKLTFTSFNLEANADNLLIYDGSTTSAPLIGTYTGTTSPGTINSSGSSLLIEFRSDCSQTLAGWAASWTSTVIDNIAPTTSINVPSTWQTKNFTATFTDADNTGGSGIAKSMYHVVDNNGTEWRANPARGFYRDNFTTSIHPDWNAPTGTWAIDAGALVQTDETLANTNISAPLTQNLSSRYLYSWSGNIEGAGTNRRAGIYIMCDDATATDRGNAYMIWFRADLGQVDIYKSVNNVLGSPVKSDAVTINPGTMYAYKIVFDRSTGEMKVYVDNNLVSSWTDISPFTDGSYISFRTGNCKYTVDNLYVYRSRSATATITVGAASTNAARYQNSNPGSPACMIKSIVMDSAENLSSVASKSVNIDWTAPSNVAVVRDGTGNDINVTTSATQLSANWNKSTDVNSGVVKYWYAIGKTAGAKDVVNWTDNDTNTSVTKTGMSLINGQMYYIMIKAENGAGLLSDSVSSDGQLVQTTTSIKEQTDIFNITAFPNPFNNNITITYELNKNQEVEIKLSDVLGKEMIIKNSTNQIAGKHSITINAEAMGLAKGIYILKIRTENNENIIKVIRY